ncbi:hypothetical protein RYX36_025065 [Vicia faba]
MHLTSINADLQRGAGPRRFTYKELKFATNNFSILIAVKKISKESRQEKKEYVTEVKVISQLRHRNLVMLLGWCHDKGDKVIRIESYFVVRVRVRVTTTWHILSGDHVSCPRIVLR